MGRREGQLESLLHNLRWEFLPDGDEQLSKDLEALADRIRSANRLNLLAHLPVSNIDEETADLSEYSPGEDYEVGCRIRNSHDADLLCTPEEHDDISEAARETADELAEKIEEIETQIDELKSDLEDAADEEDPVRYDEVGGDLDTLKKELAEATEAHKEADAIADGWERFEEDMDEILIYTVRRYGDEDPDEEIARRLGFGIVRFISGEHDGEAYLGLQGGGQDMSPMFAAYQALRYGCVQPCYERHFRPGSSFDWFKYACGGGICVVRDVLEALGVLDIAVISGTFHLQICSSDCVTMPTSMERLRVARISRSTVRHPHEATIGPRCGQNFVVRTDTQTYGSAPRCAVKSASRSTAQMAKPPT